MRNHLSGQACRSGGDPVREEWQVGAVNPAYSGKISYHESPRSPRERRGRAFRRALPAPRILMTVDNTRRGHGTAATDQEHNRSSATSSTRADEVVTSSEARKVLAALRLTTGFIFLWAFLDKTFGLGFSTPSERAWINGGKPSQGFLTSDAVQGPLKGFFASIASPVSDVLLMLGMLGIGLAVMLGIGTRVAAWAGSVVMVLMYLAELPAAGGSNPLIDSHVIYALVLVLVALTSAGDTWGLGRWWKSLEIVRKNPWLI